MLTPAEHGLDTGRCYIVAHSRTSDRVHRMTHLPTAADAFPVRTKQFSQEIQDNHTDFLLCAYADQVMITVTQTDNLGTIMQSRWHFMQCSLASNGMNFQLSISVFSEQTQILMVQPPSASVYWSGTGVTRR